MDLSAVTAWADQAIKSIRDPHHEVTRTLPPAPEPGHGDRVNAIYKAWRLSRVGIALPPDVPAWAQSREREMPHEFLARATDRLTAGEFEAVRKAYAGDDTQWRAWIEGVMRQADREAANLGLGGPDTMEDQALKGLEFAWREWVPPFEVRPVADWAEQVVKASAEKAAEADTRKTTLTADESREIMEFDLRSDARQWCERRRRVLMGLPEYEWDSTSPAPDQVVVRYTGDDALNSWLDERASQAVSRLMWAYDDKNYVAVMRSCGGVRKFYDWVKATLSRLVTEAEAELKLKADPGDGDNPTPGSTQDATAGSPKPMKLT